MILRTVHTTEYAYGEEVSLCHTETRLAPRPDTAQKLIEHELIVEPLPAWSIARKDFFGNAVAAFSIEQSHQVLRITSKNVVQTAPAEAIHPALTPPWEQVRAALRRHDGDRLFNAFQFVFESPRVPLTPQIADYAAPSFPTGRPLLECALDLNHRIHADFTYDSGATTVMTSVEEVLQAHHGVCQDFAHVMIACMRSLGLPARYVSGYLHTEKSAGLASHAWMSVFCPGFGWLDLDPTNDVVASEKHVTLGWGRDYSDVPPVKGVALGGGDQKITVEVTVTPA